MGGRSPQAIITVVTLFDWIRRGSVPADPQDWRARLEDDAVVIETSRGGFAHAPLAGAHSVRIVPLNRGGHHAQASGWQVALARADGDVLVGQPLADWHSALELARLLCETTALPLDELTQRLFSRVEGVGKVRM
jgi:hypothetical protein